MDTVGRQKTEKSGHIARTHDCWSGACAIRIAKLKEAEFGSSFGKRSKRRNRTSLGVALEALKSRLWLKRNDISPEMKRSGHGLREDHTDTYQQNQSKRRGRPEGVAQQAFAARAAVSLTRQIVLTVVGQVGACWQDVVNC